MNENVMNSLNPIQCTAMKQMQFLIKGHTLKTCLTGDG